MTSTCARILCVAASIFIFSATPRSAAAPVTPVALRLTAQDKTDMEYVRGLHKNDPRRPYSARLDFADPVQYRYFMRQLELVGVTPVKFPQLFRSLAETRSAHLARGRLASLDVPNCGQDQVCPVNILSTFGAPATNPQNFNITAFSSIPGNPSYTLNTIGLYDQNSNVFAGPSSQSQTGTGYDLVNSVNGTAPSTSAVVQASGVWYYVPAGGGGVPGSFSAEVGQGQDPTIVNTSPTNVCGNTSIEVCVHRQNIFCDYWYETSSGGQFIVKFPLKGNVTYPNPILADANKHPLNAQSNVTISQPNQTQGGGCQPLPINQSLGSLATVSNNVVSWTINPASFGVATPCFPSGSTVVFDLMLTVFDTANKPWLISITSAQGQPVSNQLRIFPMTVAYGCVAAGTLVTMADGTKKAIQTIDAGELIQSNARRIPLTVENYTKGFEKKLMYLLSTANGRELLATEGHPVVTLKGVKVAKQLAVGDVLITDAGESRLVRIQTRKFDGDVWNLDVGRYTDGVRLTDTNTTFYANGVLVGDGRMQQRLDRAEYESPAQVLKRLDKRWLVDYRSNEAMMAERRRRGQ